MTKPHTSRRYMTPVKFKGDKAETLGYVASCRDCRFWTAARSEEKRNRLALHHQRIMEMMMRVKNNKQQNREMAEKMLRSVITRLGEQETIDAFVANNEGYWCDPMTDALIDALPAFDSDAHVLLMEYLESGESITEALIKVMVTQNPEFR